MAVLACSIILKGVSVFLTFFLWCFTAKYYKFD